MANRRTYHSIELKSEGELTLDLRNLRSYGIYSPTDSESPRTITLGSLSELVVSNSWIMNQTRVEIREIMEPLVGLLAVHTKLQREFPGNSIELCPRNETNYSPGSSRLDVMIRYYDQKSLDEFDRLLRDIFIIGSVEERG